MTGKERQPSLNSFGQEKSDWQSGLEHLSPGGVNQEFRIIPPSQPERPVLPEMIFPTEIDPPEQSNQLSPLQPPQLVQSLEISIPMPPREKPPAQKSPTARLALSSAVLATATLACTLSETIFSGTPSAGAVKGSFGLLIAATLLWPRPIGGIIKEITQSGSIWHCLCRTGLLLSPYASIGIIGGLIGWHTPVLGTYFLLGPPIAVILSTIRHIKRFFGGPGSQ
jgi:hypothetical protein